MARHGVRTIFIQTANSDSVRAFVHPSALGTFIAEAHARHMYVVAWYLPDLRPTPLDYERVMQAIEFRTAGGEKFDSFALDIEPNGVKSADARNRALTTLSEVLRAQPGCASTPVHMIGGISGDSSAAQVTQFVRAVNETGCIGASLYGWAGTSHAAWRLMSAVEAKP